MFVSYDILTRRFFPRLQFPSNVCAYDWEYMLYGTLFMMAGAYTLSRNGHVRGDIFYRNWSVRTQATVDLVLYFAFFLPGIVFLVWAGWGFATEAFLRAERSAVCPTGPYVWPYKFVMPIAGGFMLLQGIAEMARCVQAITTGAWPLRYADVEETETRLAQESQL